MPSFPIPEGFRLPEGVLEGETFDAVGTYMVKDGMIIHSAIEGNPIPGYEEEEEVEVEEEGGEEEEMEEVEGETPGDRFMKTFNNRSKKAAY